MASTNACQLRESDLKVGIRIVFAAAQLGELVENSLPIPPAYSPVQVTSVVDVC